MQQLIIWPSYCQCYGRNWSGSPGILRTDGEMLKSQGVREGPPRCFGSMVAFFLCVCVCFCFLIFLFIYTLYTLHLHNKQLSTYLLELFFVPFFTFLGGSNITSRNVFVSNSSMTSQYTTAEFLNLDWPYATSHQWVHI